MSRITGNRLFCESNRERQKCTLREDVLACDNSYANYQRHCLPKDTGSLGKQTSCSLQKPINIEHVRLFCFSSLGEHLLLDV